MNTFAFPLKTLALAASITALLAACGGSSTGTAPSETFASLQPTPVPATPPSSAPAPSTGTTAAETPVAPTPPATSPAPAPAPDMMPSQSPLPLPTAVANGSVVALECGRLYQGTLDLRGKSDVTVQTSGTCGNAVISPGQAVTGWTRYQGNVFSAPVSFDVAQVTLAGQPLSLAHWPNRPQTWVKATGSSMNSLSYTMPNADLVGATLVFKPYEWAVDARRITSYSGSTMSLATTGNINFDGYAPSGAVEFYVEGKLWMLDEAGEWAVNGGRVYVWTPDGQSPEGRVWISPDQDGIDARDSRSVTIENVSIHGAANGINALNATKLRVLDSSIVNSSGNGILNSGGSGLQVEGTTIRNARHDAVAVKWGGGGETIRNSRVESAGSLGMPTNAHAAINLTAGSGALVQNNSVVNSGYIGIRVFRGATVADNTVDGACLVLTDCGGIFTSAPDKAPLNTRIDRNVVSNVGPTQRLAWGLYLGDFANGVTVTGNTVSSSGNGMEILNGFDNQVTENTFSRNTQSHIQMVEFGSTPIVKNNTVARNRFTAAGKEEMFRLSSEQGTSAVGRFGSYADNRYVSSSSIFANYNGEALSFTQWKSRTGQDASSTLTAP